MFRLHYVVISIYCFLLSIFNHNGSCLTFAKQLLLAITELQRERERELYTFPATQG